MSIHPSLKIDSASAQQRSVLSRIERIKDLMKKGLWTEKQGVIALPKTKILRIKATKAAKEEKAAEGTAAPGAAPAKEASAKGAAPAAGKAAPAAAKAKEAPAKAAPAKEKK